VPTGGRIAQHDLDRDPVAVDADALDRARRAKVGAGMRIGDARERFGNA